VVVVWGMAFGLIPVALTGWMMQAVPDAPEAGQALLVSGFQVAIASGALAGGVVVDGYGIASTMLMSAALVLVAAAVIATLGRAPRALALNASAEQS
jgi:predicted MFS family arabinose efflux permease